MSTKPGPSIPTESTESPIEALKTTKPIPEHTSSARLPEKDTKNRLIKHSEHMRRCKDRQEKEQASKVKDKLGIGQNKVDLPNSVKIEPDSVKIVKFTIPQLVDEITRLYHKCKDSQSVTDQKTALDCLTRLTDLQIKLGMDAQPTQQYDLDRLSSKELKGLLRLLGKCMTDISSPLPRKRGRPRKVKALGSK